MPNRPQGDLSACSWARCRRGWGFRYSGPRKLDHQLSYSGGPGKGERWQASGSCTRRRSRPRWPSALKGDQTVNELASQYGVHPTLIHSWKKQLLAGANQVFSNGSQAATADPEAEKADLSEQIGQLKMELQWLKKLDSGENAIKSWGIQLPLGRRVAH